jgi:hypothetical protein
VNRRRSLRTNLFVATVLVVVLSVGLMLVVGALLTRRQVEHATLEGVAHQADVLTAREVLSIFPLAGALLFPRMHLPLHIFEPRYCAMVSDAMARDRRIGMIQPRGSDFISLTSIQPDSRVITIGAASEDLRLVSF